MTQPTPTQPEGEELATASELVNRGDTPGALRALDRSLAGIAYRMDRKFLRNLVVMIVGVLVLIGVGAVAVAASRSADTARRSLASYQRAQTRVRIGSCEQYNLQQDVQVHAEIVQSHDLVAALARGVPDPADRKRQVDAYNMTHDAIIKGGHAHRDCTPAGIARYLSGTTVPKL